MNKLIGRIRSRGAAMKHTIHVHVHLMEPAQVAQINALAESPSVTMETKVLAQAVLTLNQSVHDLFGVLRSIAESGALRVRES
jgi:hypothetical protein